MISRLDKVTQPDHDGITSDGHRVQIKATFQDALTFKTVPEYYLGLKLYQDGQFKEIYNGPGNLMFEKYAHRKGIGDPIDIAYGALYLATMNPNS
jgi:hypothetical protein